MRKGTSQVLNGFEHLCLMYLGPGCSSIGGGAFTELGPFFPTGDGRSLRVNSKSWNKGKMVEHFWSPVKIMGNICIVLQRTLL